MAAAAVMAEVDPAMAAAVMETAEEEEGKKQMMMLAMPFINRQWLEWLNEFMP